MRAYRSLPVLILGPLWLAACATEPPPPPGIFDLANEPDRPSSGDDAHTPPGALLPPAAGSINNSIGAPTPGRQGGGIGN